MKIIGILVVILMLVVATSQTMFVEVKASPKNEQQYYVLGAVVWLVFLAGVAANYL